MSEVAIAASNRSAFGFGQLASTIQSAGSMHVNNMRSNFNQS